MFQDKFVAKYKSMILWYRKKLHIKSNQDPQRLSEVSLFFNAIFFASIGAVLGIILFRHKKNKFYFVAGFSFLLVLHLSFLFLLSQYLAHTYNASFTLDFTQLTKIILR